MMKRAALLIITSAFCVFSTKGVGFTTEPSNPLFALEGDNSSLEWRYTFGNESFRHATFGNAKIPRMADFFFTDSFPWIEPSNRGRLQVKITNNYTLITLLGVRRTDNGIYHLTVTANPSRRSQTSKVEILVHFPPEFISSPQNVTVIEEQNINFTLDCTVNGNPTPDVKWTKDGIDISENQRINVSEFIGNTSSLTIINIKRGDEGQYRCMANNRVKTTISAPGKLTVNFRADVKISGSEPKFVEINKRIHLTCQYNASPPVSEVQWVKDGNVIARNDGGLVKITQFTEGQLQLLISSSTKQDEGNYTCFVTNAVGNSSDTTSLLIQVPSEAPTFVVTVFNSTVVNVSWQMLSNETARGAILGYYVLYRVKNTTSWTNQTVDGAGATSLSVGSLNEYTTYEFAMQTLNEKGVSNLSALVEKTTNQHKPSGPPQQVILSEVTSKSVKVSWGPVLAVDRNGIIRGYKVNYRALPNGSNFTEFVNIPSGQQGGGRTKVLKALNEFTNYSISVLAFTKVGDGPLSDVKFVQTLQDKPSAAPVNVRGRNTSSTSILVEWYDVPVFDQNGIITGYTITYRSQTKNHNGFAIVGPDVLQKELTSLREYVNYDITIRASTSKGDGPDSNPIVIRTDQDKPSAAPANVRGRNTSSTSILIRWDDVPAFDQNGIITSYTITYQSQTEGHNGFVITGPSDRQKELTNLREYVNYDITIFASTSKGDGPHSSPGIVVRTDQDKPSAPPTSIRGHNTSSTSILIEWGEVPPADQNGVILTYTIRYQSLTQKNKGSETVASSIKNLNLTGLMEFVDYNITLFASTVKGNGIRSDPIFVITDQDKPSGTPQAVTVNMISSGSIFVSWNPVIADDRNGIIKGYKVNYQALPNGDMVAKFLNVTYEQQNKRQTVILDNLNEFTNYSIRVLAFTAFGNGPASFSQVVETLGGKPSNAPQAVKVSVTSSQTISVSWNPVIADDRNGVIKGYKVSYQAFPNGDMAVKFLYITYAQQNERQTIILDNLNEFANYSIGVLAFTVFGNGPVSVGQVVETMEGKPSRGAENVSSSEVNYTTNKITWAGLPKEAANGVIKLYEVRLELKESCLKVDFTFHAMNTTKSSVLVTGFWMCAKYEVSVRGYTVAGPGPYSKAIVVQTKSLKLSQAWSKETPSPPSFSQIRSGEGTTANITLPRFPGNAKFFQVIVIRYNVDYTGEVNSPDSFTPKDLMTYEEAHKSPVPAAYVTFQFRGQDFDAFRDFVVGDGGHSSSKIRNKGSSDGEVFLNKPLQPNTNYRVFIRAFIEKMVYVSSNFVTIETKGKPDVKDLPEKTIFQVGDVVVLKCEVTGDPQPSVTWSKDGNTSIPRAQFRNNGHILVIQEVASSDGGIYECRASNIFGQRRTATAVIIASIINRVPPSIMKDVSPRSVPCAKGIPCSLLCHATSEIIFNYSWTRNGQALDGHNIKVMNNSVIITPLDDEDFGDYACHATNSFGSTTYKITLSGSREEENNTQSIFRANDIAWSCIVFVLLVLIGVLIWRLRRAQASNRAATAKKATIINTVQSVFPLEQHVSESGSYMELRPRPSDGQTRLPPEYQSLQGSYMNAGYYNVVPEEGNKRGSNEEIYEEIELSDR